MAEVAISGGSHKGGAPKQRKKSTRIDMTAMVDVAFLLLTFFILTTTLATPKMMKLTLPPDEGDPVEVVQEKVMTLYLGENDQVHCTYFTEASDEPIVETTDFSSGGLRRMVQQHLKRKPRLCPEGATVDEMRSSGCWDPIFVVKPTAHSTYRNVVDALDEMGINNVRKYALTEVLAADSLFLADHGLK